MNIRNTQISWKDLAELIVIASVVVSLVFVGLQMRQTQKIARGELLAILNANEIEVDRSFMEHADIWIRGNRGEALDDVEREIFAGLVKQRNDSYYYSITSGRLLGLDNGVDGFVTNFASFLNRYPLAQEIWLERERRLQNDRRLLNPGLPEANEWVAMVTAALEKIEAEDQAADILHEEVETPPPKNE